MDHELKFHEHTSKKLLIIASYLVKEVTEIVNK